MRKINIYWILICIVGLFVYSCGNNSSDSNGDKKNAQSGEASSSIDVDAYSDSKGVGEFNKVEIGDNIDEAMAEHGEEIFQTKCTVCHQPSTQKLIGPGLKGITKIRTPEWILNMITNPDKMLDQDEVAKALLAQYNGTRMTDQGVDKEDARALLEYLRQNDAE